MTTAQKAKNIAKSLVKTVEAKLKILSKIKGEKFEQANINTEDVREFVRLKNERDRVLAELEKIGAQYEASRQKIISQLPGGETDEVDVIIEGVRIHKFPKNKEAGKLDENKVLLLAKRKRLLDKIAPKVRKLDKEALLLAIAEEKITYEEYLSCTSQVIVPVINLEIVEAAETAQPVMKIAE